VIWIGEQGGHPYRIRRAGAAVPPDAAAIPPSLLATAPGAGTTILSGSAAGAASVEIADHAVIARFVNPPWDGAQYHGVLVARWHTAHTPDDAEAALAGVMVDHATALVQRERTTAGAPTGQRAHPGSALSATQRIAAASGILMSLHHLSTSQARSLLSRASEHTHRPVIDIADTVLRTGTLPPQTRDPATGSTGPSTQDQQQAPPVPVTGRP
jgi:hypothetical protein